MSGPSILTAPARLRVLAVALLLLATFAVGVRARVTPRPETSPPRPVALGGNGPVGVEVRLDRGSVLRGGDGVARLELVLRGREVSRSRPPERVPTDVVVILDRSGSMSGEPMEMARAAVRELLAGLAPEDRFALVSYSNDARKDVALEPPSPDARERWRRAVAAIDASGGTNMSSGLDLAHETLTRDGQRGRVARLILLSDGHANQGDHSRSGLGRRAARALGGEYVLSAVGVGQGFDESLMSAMADAGTGNFYYLHDLQRLAGIFADEFASARDTVASALRVEITPEDGIAVDDAAGYPLVREAGRVVFHPGALFSGQERRIWVTLRAPTSRLGEVGLGRLRVGFEDAEGRAREADLEVLPTLACVEGEDSYYASFDRDVYLRSSSDALGALKQSVAGKVQAGLQSEAVDDIDRHLGQMRTEQLRALGYVVEGDVSHMNVLRDQVAAPAAAEPEIRNRLGKKLLEEGRDARRKGAKRGQ